MERYRILLADDHALFRQGAKKILDGTDDLEVVGEANDGLELLARLNGPLPDMVILDISMPNLRGIEALHEVKRKCPEVKILILSMHREYLHQALSAGANGYLLKEDADRILFSAISSIRKGKTYVSPRLKDEMTDGMTPVDDPLSVREKEVLKLIAEGKSNREIGEALFISIRTVESHRASILDKLNLRHTADLVRYAIRKGYL